MRTLFLAGVMLLLAACAPGPAVVSAVPDTWPEGRSYQAVSVLSQGRDRPLVAGTQLRIRFDRPGYLVVEAGCNTIGVSSRLDGRRMTDVGFTSTAMGCAPERLDQDAWLVDFFGDEPTVDTAADAVDFTTADATIRLIPT
jgi:heat shock protein HslJ